MALSRNISVSEASRPKLPRHTRLKFDETRQVWVILAPERVLAPDEIAVEVLHLCDGVRSVAEMADQLAVKYAAPREAILTDVVAMLQDLADKGFLTEARGEDAMSDLLADGKTAGAAPSDGLAVLESQRSTAETFGIPLAVLAELTHRCPLQCPYCSNPIELDRGGQRTHDRGMEEGAQRARRNRRAADPFLSGGEPTARKDLVELVQHATDVGLYSNLITSAVLLTKEKLSALADAGLCHVQISFQGNEPDVADRVAGPEERAPEKDRSREMDARARPAADGQRRSCTARTCTSSSDIIQMAGRSRRRPARSRQRSVLRLGAEEPRRPDADAANRSRRPAASSRKPPCD
jgi:coenzyme PQQ biosynthesis protein PqqD